MVDMMHKGSEPLKAFRYKVEWWDQEGHHEETFDQEAPARAKDFEETGKGNKTRFEVMRYGT